MSRPVTPGGGAGGGNEAAWIIPGVGALLLITSAATWLGGTLAAAHTGTGGPRASFSLALFVQVLRDGPDSRWPGVSPALVWGLTGGLTGLLTVPVVVVAVVLFSRRLRADDPRRSLASVGDVAHLTMPQVATSATRLRPSLAGRKPAEVSAGDAGLALGRLGTGDKGRVLFSSWEDVVLAYMAPRSGKSTALAIPAVLSAPGAVIATSNKADVWSATAAIRADETGQRVWTFDPQHIAWAPRPGGGTRWPTSPPSRRPSGWRRTLC